MGCGSSSAAGAIEKLQAGVKSAVGMEAGKVAGFNSPITCLEIEKLIKSETEPGRPDQVFLTKDEKLWMGAVAGVGVGTQAFVAMGNGTFWRVDFSNKDVEKNAIQLGSDLKYKSATAIVHHDNKLYMFADTIYKCDVGLGIGLPSSDVAIKTEAFAADDGNWHGTRCATMYDGKCYAICEGSLYQIDLEEKDAGKNTRLISDEGWGSATSIFFYEKRLFIVAGKIYEIPDWKTESKWCKPGYITFDEQHSYNATSALVYDHHVLLSGWGTYLLKLDNVASGAVRPVKHWKDYGPKVMVQFH